MTGEANETVAPRYAAFMRWHGREPVETNLDAFRRDHPNWDFQAWVSGMLRAAADAGRGVRWTVGVPRHPRLHDEAEFSRFIDEQVMARRGKGVSRTRPLPPSSQSPRPAGSTRDFTSPSTSSRLESGT